MNYDDWKLQTPPENEDNETCFCFVCGKEHELSNYNAVDVDGLPEQFCSKHYNELVEENRFNKLNK